MPRPAFSMRRRRGCRSRPWRGVEQAGLVAGEGTGHGVPFVGGRNRFSRSACICFKSSIGSAWRSCSVSVVARATFPGG